MSANDFSSIKSLLLLDDDVDMLELLGHLLSKQVTGRIVKVRYPSQAASLANDYFFDAIAMDVTMEFHGSPFGGLDLYHRLLPRYGDSALVAYSQNVTDHLIRQYDYNTNFVERGSDMLAFSKEILSKISALRRNQTCFIAMPFSQRYDKIYASLRRSISAAGYRAVRIDKEPFTDSIVNKILDAIRRSKLVLFLAADKNANAFYECGYAVALRKEVVTVTNDLASLPFDVRDRKAISYEGEAGLDELEAILADKIIELTRVPEI